MSRRNETSVATEHFLSRHLFSLRVETFLSSPLLCRRHGCRKGPVDRLLQGPERRSAKQTAGEDLDNVTPSRASQGKRPALRLLQQQAHNPSPGAAAEGTDSKVGRTDGDGNEFSEEVKRCSYSWSVSRERGSSAFGIAKAPRTRFTGARSAVVHLAARPERVVILFLQRPQWQQPSPLPFRNPCGWAKRGIKDDESFILQTYRGFVLHACLRGTPLVAEYR
ncbi:hypothetical protein BDK51DRAFT_39255 [Blyttiomyces helicus]|uniref:Uncharacterized protein n=1 Tax=Blyttiomyces helicus TaxID=388810 RepID=A0A4P9W523_9FUNG|nr:hypothetical protein BDK51DRAFT_39255 [Blyttiomyces helicus]|eukprot:RKO87334.1 hypothetical protein BDK51DRAFT_39255 [Blyttiomyces helicus]